MRSEVSHLLSSTGPGDQLFELHQIGGGLVVHHPDLARQVLCGTLGRFGKGPVQQSMFGRLLGDSVSMLEGEPHTHLRRLLAPMFTRQAAAEAIPIILNVFEQATDDWPKRSPLDLFAALCDLTVATVGMTLIADSELWHEGPFTRARARIWQSMNDLAMRPIAAAQPPEDQDILAVGDDIETVRGYIRRALAERLRHPRSDVLSGLGLLARRGHLTPRQAIDQLIALLLAAHETNAGALYWALVLLGTHPEWHKRVIAEVDRRRKCQVTLDDLAQMSSVSTTIMESLRLFPPAARQFRVTTKDVQLGSRLVPSGTAVFVSHLALHTREDLFSQPYDFDPGRWISSKPPSAGFIPFGAGRHRCLGRHYATVELSVLLTAILRRFTISFPEPADMRVALAIALRPAVPARVIVTGRPS